MLALLQYPVIAGQDYRVGLSMFSDLRTSWSPRVMEASEEAEASWINVPTYLAMRHAAQNWGHHAVEILGGKAKFTAQLWPLLSDWAPLEKARLPERAPGTRLLCFRSVVAGMAPWRRPIQLKDAEGPCSMQREE
eukprot:Skav220353  [mRNA]  locus=scaffold5657:22772:26705:+ [translate_table: standard]